jgi:hypothetical protein
MKTLVISAFTVALILFGCSSSDGPSGATGGPVPGAQDSHCSLPDGGLMAQVVDLSTCHLDADAGAPVYGPTNFNSSANDDDCKYHVSFTATPIQENLNVTFTVLAAYLTDNTPATGASTLAEVYLNDTHPAPNSGQATTEPSPGIYQIGPIVFDSPGQWTVRFHLHEECQDATDDSPHGHAAFFIAVP